VVGVIDGKRRGRALMFCGHTDTVGVTGMKDPFLRSSETVDCAVARAGHEGASPR
jgi:acetylornithine deacetylase/succinyl-diaminopimelate desuccinylase-like protein